MENEYFPQYNKKSCVCKCICKKIKENGGFNNFLAGKVIQFLCRKYYLFWRQKLIISNWRIYLFVGEKWKYFQSWLHSCYHVLQIPPPPPPYFPLYIYLTASLSMKKMQSKKEGYGGMGGCWCTLSVQFIISAHLIIEFFFFTPTVLMK